jgi:hypothetical protein
MLSTQSIGQARLGKKAKAGNPYLALGQRWAIHTCLAHASLDSILRLQEKASSL